MRILIVGARGFIGRHIAEALEAAGFEVARAGRVYVHLGGPAGLAASPLRVIDGPDGPGGRFGAMVSVPGDSDGDGFADLVIGATEARQGAGAAYLFRGGPGGPADRISAVFADPRSADARFGTAGVTLY